MEVALPWAGKSHGVWIPESILAAAGREGIAGLRERDALIEVRAIRRNPREGGADEAQRLAVQRAEALARPEAINE